MRKGGWLLVVLCLLLRALPVLALVDPVPTAKSPPGWMAVIQLWSKSDNSFHQFCKGALIAPQWVLSSGLCMIDPNHYLDNLYPGDDPSFWIKLGPNGDLVEVEKYYFSDDYRIALFRIALPSADAPLPLTARTASQLLGSQITIWNKEKSLAVSNSFFNPGNTGVLATCQMSGTDFQITGAYCYLLTKVTSSTSLYQTTATVIDPKGSSAPTTPLDQAATIDTSGKQLYLDFRSALTYPCLEDVGAPLLVKAADGSDEIAGVVGGVGADGGMSICGMSMYNVFPSAAAIKSFVDQSYASYDFASLCPAIPVPVVTYTSDTGISLQWNKVKGALGYRVHFTTRQGQVPIATVDVQTQTTINTVLAHATDYLVAVTAYNASCSSALSKTLAVNVDVH
jgi:hypothetical protein